MVQVHLDSHVQDGWTLADHSTAAYVDPTSGSEKVIYSFVWQREPQTIVNLVGTRGLTRLA